MPNSKERLFDVRAIERNIKHGLISRADVEKYLAGLPDAAAKAITLGEVEDLRAPAEREPREPREPSPSEPVASPPPLDNQPLP